MLRIDKLKDIGTDWNTRRPSVGLTKTCKHTMSDSSRRLLGRHW